MKYKVGDKVKLKSKEGLDELKQQHENLYIPPVLYEKAGSVCTIRSIYDCFYSFEEMPLFWAESLIEELVKEPIILNGKEVVLKLADIELPSGKIDIWELPEGYQFVDENGNVINATKIVLLKKKKEYPKTYEECCKVLGIDTLGHNVDGYKWELLATFQDLIICRDAYWKLYGEEMGLGKPWEPDWLNDDVTKYVISHHGNTFGTKGGLNYINYILAFPTEEMRDAFYENFKEEIEQCKELL